nr:SMR family transporter [Neobacillus niacini]
MMNRSWIYVILTCLSEFLWIYGFHNATTWWHWVFIAGFILLDFQFLAKACENLPTGTVYAIFAGAGTVGTFLMDVFLFDEEVSFLKIFFILLVIGGVVGLKISDNIKSEGVDQ